jgi:colanic acid/amylovoran biosynthesis glycosyltransferase
LHPAIRLLRKAISDSDYLHFAIGGLLGDWGAVGAIIAHHRDRRFAVWTDRVESQVVAFQAASKKGLRKYYYSLLAELMKRYERQIVRMSTLGLFHGMDCYHAYAPYSSNPHLVHNIHLGQDSRISSSDLNTRLKSTGPMKIAYAGRAHRDKGIFDWIEVLSLAAKNGIDFNAVWFGDGPELENARQRVASLDLSGRVQFPGALSPHSILIDKLRAFDLFLFCHKTMESPRCLIEAVMCGLPLVGYESPYPQDLIKEHGGGLLSPIGDVNLLVESICRFREQKVSLTQKAQLDGKLFDAESVFRHRSELIKGNLAISAPQTSLRC